MDMNRSKSCKICKNVRELFLIIVHTSLSHRRYSSFVSFRMHWLLLLLWCINISKRVQHIGLKWLLRLVNRWQQKEAPWKWINGTAQCRRMAQQNEYNKRNGRTKGRRKNKERFEMRPMEAIDECIRNGVSPRVSVCVCEFHFMLAYIQIHALARVHTITFDYIVCFCTCTAECMH